MGYRVLFLANPVKLSVKYEQLIVDNGEITKIPLEDIECVVADTAQLNITAYLLMKFSEYKVSFIVTDRAHHPCGMFLPLAENHSRFDRLPDGTRSRRHRAGRRMRARIDRSGCSA